MKPIQSSAIITAFRSHSVSHVIGVPDNGSRRLFETLWDTPDIQTVLVSREGEAFGLATGLHVGGAMPVVLIQNTGLLEAGDAFRGTPYNMRIPLVMLVGYRGFGGHREGGDRVDTAATFLEPTLRAWNIPYLFADPDNFAAQLDQTFEAALADSLPAALLMTMATV